MNTKIILALGLVLSAGSAIAAEEPQIIEHNQMMDHGDGHLMDMEGGMVMGQNKDKLPAGCDRVSEDVQITVHAGRKYSKSFPGTMFGFDKHEWRVKPCTRLTVHFINDDPVRHQWMMHGLPKFMYDKGMFHLEVTGPAKVSGTLILPLEDRTYLVHCDIAQHMEKGMKGQLVVGKGSGTFPSIPGVTDPAIFDNYGPVQAAPETAAVSVPALAAAPSSAEPVAGNGQTAGGAPLFSGSLVIGFVAGVFGAPMAYGYYNRRLKGRPLGEILGAVAAALKGFACRLNALLRWLYRRFKEGQRYLSKDKN
jgi:plastocyanin